MNEDATKPLKQWEKGALALFVAVLFVFGVQVVIRSAFLDRRMGDLDVFLRAAWAVRNDKDPYAASSENEWHYLYPPLYAILMTPFADPPRGADPSGCLSYPVSVVLVYLISLASLFAGVHVMASALEARAADTSFQTQPRFCRRWWALRISPILVCFLPIGHTLMRGQVNLIILAALCAALAGWIRGQSFRAGMWLALAICIKVIPAFLLVYPLWKRDWRGVVGCTVGLLIGLIVVPGAVFGPAKTVTRYEAYGKGFFAPFFDLNKNTSRKEEILGSVNATESVGVRNALHNWMYPDAKHRPADMDRVAQIAFVVLGVVMTFMTLWPARNTSTRVAYCGGGLILLMAIFSPVCHSHYLLFCLPIVMSLLAGAWQNQPTVHMPSLLVTTFGLFFWTMAIAYLPGMEILKDRCASLFATLPLWGITIFYLWRAKAVPASSEVMTTADSRLAA